MNTQKIDVVLNIPDIEIAEKLMGKALAELINNRINRLPIEYRKEACEQILNTKVSNTCKG